MLESGLMEQVAGEHDSSINRKGLHHKISNII
jgi:hypothetical protein